MSDTQKTTCEKCIYFFPFTEFAFQDVETLELVDYQTKNNRNGHTGLCRIICNRETKPIKRMGKSITASYLELASIYDKPCDLFSEKQQNG